MGYLQRKYIDLIRDVSSKWANWDPPIPVEVGAFGEIEPDSGALRVVGNIYHPDFQIELNRLGLSNFRVANYPPQDGGIEEDIIIASKGARRLDFSLAPNVAIAGIANASLKGQWQFERGKRDALLIMHSPRQRFLPPDVILDKLHKVPLLKDKWLVTSVHVCPAYSMYLSNKAGEKLSLALFAKAPIPGAVGVTVGADAGFGWWSDLQADYFRKACDTAGNYCYTPLFQMKRRIGWVQRLFREEEEPEDLPSGDELWVDVTAPWDPLNEDGEEDSLEHGEEDADEF